MPPPPSVALAEQNTGPVAELIGVSKIYGQGDLCVKALDQLDLTVSRGDYLAVMGASGSGKSTAMNILGCLDVPTSGVFRFKGVEVQALDRDHHNALCKVVRAHAHELLVRVVTPLRWELLRAFAGRHAVAVLGHLGLDQRDRIGRVFECRLGLGFLGGLGLGS